MRKLSWLLAVVLAFALFSCSKDEAPEPNADLFIPSAFTPDGDGVNDTFLVKGTDITFYRIEIFDESKTPVYISETINAGWNGKYKNQPMPAGNYLWVIEYIKSGKARQRLTGYVELIR